MAINPELITTIRVDQLPDEALSLTNLFPHTVGTDLKSATIQELVDLVATAIGVSGGVGFLPISVTDGQQLPDVPESPGFFLCGAGTYLNINGYPDVICTDELNAVMSLTDHWQLAVGIPIVAEVGVQSVTGSAVDNTDPLNPVINSTGGGGTPTLQEVLDNNHDLVDGNNFQGTNAGDDNTGINVNAFGISAAENNIGNFVNALGNGAANNNEGINVNALGITAAFINTGNNVNALGYEAGFTNTGDNVNSLGKNAAQSNTGNSVNALGQETAVENIGNDVNALGFRAGVNNAFNNVNLFGETAQADENGQTVLSKDGPIMARLSTTDLTDTRKYNFPDADGTIALLSDIPSGGVTSVGLTMPSAFTVTNSPITSSGDIAVTGAGLVSQYVRGDGTLANFPASTGGGASVSFYLNGSVSQGTIGGVAFREMDRTPILGAGTDFTINADGYIQSFITDANVPNQLEIPAGNWNFETYFSASSGGGSPSFYVELYKWNGTTLSLIASNSATPRLITDGTNIEAYFSALAVPQTTLLATDRLAVRIYVTHSGRTITLHTENSHLCQVITTFSTGLTALNGLTAQVQNLSVGTSGTDFAISSATDTHTFNLPTASASNRGALSSTDWSTFNNKQNVVSGVSDTEIGYLDGVTSAIQTQLNARCQSLYNLTSQITHTGTTAKTLLLTYFIPANTFTNGDFLIFSAIVTKVANISSTTHTIEINTTNTLTGATIISTGALNTVNSSMKFKREIALNGGNGYVVNVSNNATNDQSQNSTTGNLTFTYNLAADLYLFVTCQLSNATDSITYRGLSITKN